MRKFPFIAKRIIRMFRMVLMNEKNYNKENK